MAFLGIPTNKRDVANNPLARNVITGVASGAATFNDLIGDEATAARQRSFVSNVNNPSVSYNGLPNPALPKDQGTKNEGNANQYQGDGQVNLSGGNVLGSNTQDQNMARLQIEQGLQSARDAEARLNDQLGIGLGNIDRDYQSAFGRLTGQRQAAIRDNETAVNGQLSEYENTRAGNNQNARNLLFGTRRLLGQAGAGGGSADMYAAPLAAQNEAANANATAQNVSNRNLAALATAKEDNERNFDNGFADLRVQRQNSENNYRSNVDQQRADLLSNIAQLTGQQRIAQGGNYQDALSAARPITDRVSSLLNTISGLSTRTAALNPQNVTLARPDLAQYGVERYNAPAVAQQDPTLYSPAVRALLGVDEREQSAF